MQRLVIIAFFLSLFVNTSQSQTIGGVEVVKPRIYFGKWDPATKKLPVAIEFSMAPEWHLYWLNPGDAGSPPEVKWRLPEGWNVETLDFPAPQKHEDERIISYVYFDKLTLTTKILAPENPIGKTITADLKWMVCKDICVPGASQLEAKVAEGPVEITSQYVPRLVQGGYGQWSMRDINSTEKTFQLTVTKDDNALQIEDFFPGPIKNALVDFQIKEGILVYSMRPVDPLLAMGQINGLVKVEGKTFWLR